MLNNMSALEQDILQTKMKNIIHNIISINRYYNYN